MREPLSQASERRRKAPEHPERTRSHGRAGGKSAQQFDSGGAAGDRGSRARARALRRSANEKNIPNIIDMVPVRNPDFSYRILKESEVKPKLKAGWVAIHIPRFRGVLGQGFCRITGLSQHINLNLDDYGTLVWLNMDGVRTVRQLGELLKERFGDKVEPLYWRLAYFLSLLERNKLISYRSTPASGA